MKITFPHMGNTYIVAKTLFDSLGVDYIIPPLTSKKTLELGAKYSPEMACLPLKITLGNCIEAIEMGAEAVVMIGGYGPCRLGYYGEMQREILKDIGYDVDVIMLEMLDGADFKKLLNKVKEISNDCSILKVFKAVARSIRVAVEVDKLEKLTFKTRAYEKVKGSTDQIYDDFGKKMLKTKGVREIRNLIKRTKNRLRKIEMDYERKPLKIGLIGEIYSLIEPFTSFEMEKRLGRMGIKVNRSLMLGEWIVEHIAKKALFIKKNTKLEKAAKPYIETYIGGHALESIGNSVLYSRKKYDGIIQLYPLTCMPEIVAESILPSIEQDYNIPILILVIDEMTGEAGIQTRIEAFVDLLEQRREQKNIENQRQILSWN